MAASTDLATLLAVATATLSERGELIQANAGFLRLVQLAQLPPHQTNIARFFIQPTFQTLQAAPPDTQDLVYQGLLTVGEYAGQTRTLRTRIWRNSGQFQLLAEHDIEDLERLNTTILSLNHDYTQTQVELAQTNLKLQATNTRLKETQKKLVEAEKMASLGVLVAGVAHEINTPLGVSLAAASAWQGQSRQLATSFAERRMTQADLTRYLESSAGCSTLISGNLERIGHLIDSFRQVAVGGAVQGAQAFHLRKTLDNVVSSFATRLLEGGVQTRIDCAAELLVEGSPEDWASIFTHLVDNSLKHGFKGRGHGCIDIQVLQNARGALIEYRDNGLGMSAQTLARVFDPFFTTDLQQGMGLGMHLVYNLITHRLGGTITCDSKADAGVRLHIEVPSCRQNQEMPEPASA
ncbi:MAG: HAMP domain-containing histidine kinase [Comamonadaceae bacterium]|nr:HAMP domain-containing histidine kinase [Comamonadaceae bacterium]